MALLKRQSYLRDNPNTTELDWEIYLLRARPLEASETREERNVAIRKLNERK